MAYRLAERRLGEMMAEQPKAKNNVEYRWQDTGLSENPVLPITLAFRHQQEPCASGTHRESDGLDNNNAPGMIALA
jgi:hypothetical protein